MVRHFVDKTILIDTNVGYMLVQTLNAEANSHTRHSVRDGWYCASFPKLEVCFSEFLSVWFWTREDQKRKLYQVWERGAAAYFMLKRSVPRPKTLASRDQQQLLQSQSVSIFGLRVLARHVCGYMAVGTSLPCRSPTAWTLEAPRQDSSSSSLHV